MFIHPFSKALTATLHALRKDKIRSLVGLLIGHGHDRSSGKEWSIEDRMYSGSCL